MGRPTSGTNFFEVRMCREAETNATIFQKFCQRIRRKKCHFTQITPFMQKKFHGIVFKEKTPIFFR
jgi:hypothetical protein